MTTVLMFRLKGNVVVGELLKKYDKMGEVEGERGAFAWFPFPFPFMLEPGRGRTGERGELGELRDESLEAEEVGEESAENMEPVR